MTEEKSAPLLQYLFAHQQRPELACRFRWEVGSIAFWDNRCTQHNPTSRAEHARLRAVMLRFSRTSRASDVECQ
jgi:taurine dioxygenase